MHIELQPDKRYYSIGEIAKAFDKRIPYPFWDSEFDILKPKKNAKGNRSGARKTHKDTDNFLVTVGELVKQLQI
jgi:hypothetical protein